MNKLPTPGLWAFLAAFAFAFASVRGQTRRPDQKRFLDELLYRHKELQKRYDNLAFKGSLSSGPLKMLREYVMLEGMFRVIGQAPPSANNADPIAGGRITLRSRSRYYQLEKLQAESEYALTFMDTKVPAKFLQSVFLVSPYTSFLFLGRSLPEWLEDPDFKVVSVSLHEEGPTAELTFAYNSGHQYDPEAGYPPMQGKIYFDKDNMWSIIKVEFFVTQEMADRTKKDHQQSFNVTYGDTIDGVGLPRVIEHRVAGLDRPLSQYQVEEVKKVRLREEDFTPKAYGLPVPVDDDVRKLSAPKLWIAFTVGGVILLTLAYFIRTRARRRLLIR